MRKKKEVQKKWQNESASGKIQWIAFYGDCEHEILAVTSGYRVTLTYRLYSGGDYVTPSSSSTSSTSSTPSFPSPTLPPSPTEKFPALFRQFLADPLFLSDGGKIGIYTYHAYPHTAQATQPILSCTPHLLLKGIDALLFFYLSRSLGLLVDLAPVYTEFPGRGDYSCFIYDFFFIFFFFSFFD